jgi:hypothetical protein
LNPEGAGLEGDIMDVGPMALLSNTDDDPNNPIDDCWEYRGILMAIPSPGVDDYIP